LRDKPEGSGSVELSRDRKEAQRKVFFVTFDATNTLADIPQ
jgi:hypothetical protein